MKLSELTIPDAYLIEINKFTDNRGSFERVFCASEFKNQGLTTTFVQSNISFTKHRGTIRGLHIQKPPYSETKLIRCIEGAVCDFLLDLRINSPMFLKWISVKLLKEKNEMIYIPEGVAHGFQSIENNSGLLYFHSKEYKKDYEIAINFKDPLISILLPLEATEVSDRDLSHPFLTNPMEELKMFQL